MLIRGQRLSRAVLGAGSGGWTPWTQTQAAVRGVCPSELGHGALASLPLLALTLAGCDLWPEQVAGTHLRTAAGPPGSETLLDGWVWTWQDEPPEGAGDTGRPSGGLTCAHVLLGTHRTVGTQQHRRAHACAQSSP